MLVINARFLTQKITGTQRYAIELSKELKKIDPDIRFVTPQNVMHAALEKELSAERYGILRGHLWEQIELPAYLKRHNSPLLLNLSGLPPVLYANKISTIFDLSVLRHPEWFSKKYYYFYKTMLPLVAKHSTELITISNYSRQEIIDLLAVPTDRLNVVYCSVPQIFNKYAVNERRSEKRYILSVSSIDPRKNFKNLILAFNSLDIKDLELVIIGSENSVFKKQDLKTSIQSNKHIHFTGYISDDELALLYKNAALFAYPSFYEGFGMPPLEAMSFGCPAVVSNKTSLPEVFGDAAYYVDPYSVNDIANGIKEVLENDGLRKDLVTRGYERVELFSWERSAMKILEITKRHTA